MDDLYNPSSLKLLHNLLNPENSDSEPEIDDRVPTTTTAIKTTDSAFSSQFSPKDSAQSKGEPQTIDEWEEREALLIANELEHRVPPEFNIFYKQTVSPEDIYLPLSNKTPATNCCEEICIEIQMPHETVDVEQMVLDVRDNCVDLQTPIYRLNVPFPQRIDPDHGKAEWNSLKKMLTLTLRTKQKWKSVRNKFDFIVEINEIGSTHNIINWKVRTAVVVKRIEFFIIVVVSFGHWSQ